VGFDEKIPRMIAADLLIALLLSLAECGRSDGKNCLSFQIWDTNHCEPFPKKQTRNTEKKWKDSA